MPGTDAVTVEALRCPACQTVTQMVIDWPFWRCPNCRTRLIPADDPSNENGWQPDLAGG
jgi:ribosomal protein L37AE/L43A